jgi:hypothetical protein
VSAIRWATAQTGDWSVTTNWSPMRVPSITDDVTIDAYAPTLSGCRHPFSSTPSF